MNLRDLEYFVAVAELGHFGKAAERCCASQPTLSGQLKALSDELGQSLFERDSRPCRLTPFGREILPLARAALARVADISAAAQARRDPLSGPFSLGAFPTLGPWLFPSLASLVASSYPDSQLSLVEARSRDLVDQLAEGRLDAAFLALPRSEAGLECLPLFSEAFVVAVAANHPLSGRDSIDLEDLRGRELLLLEEGHCLREQALSLCNRHGALASEYRATSLETLLQMVRLGRGITLVPQLAAQARGADGLIFLGIEGRDARREIALCFRCAHPRRGLFLDLAERLRNLCGNPLPIEALPAPAIP